VFDENAVFPFCTYLLYLFTMKSREVHSSSSLMYVSAVLTPWEHQSLGNSKVMLSLCLIKYGTMKKTSLAKLSTTPWRHMEEWRCSVTHSWLWSALFSLCFTPRERAPSTRWIGGLVLFSASLDEVAKRKIPSLPLLGVESWLSKVMVPSLIINNVTIIYFRIFIKCVWSWQI